MGLCLVRKLGEEVLVEVPDRGISFSFRVSRIKPNKVTLVFDAPGEVLIYRKELWDRMEESSRDRCDAGDVDFGGLRLYHNDFDLTEGTDAAETSDR